MTTDNTCIPLIDNHREMMVKFRACEKPVRRQGVGLIAPGKADKPFNSTPTLQVEELVDGLSVKRQSAPRIKTYHDIRRASGPLRGRRRTTRMESGARNGGSADSDCPRCAFEVQCEIRIGRAWPGRQGGGPQGVQLVAAIQADGEWERVELGARNVDGTTNGEEWRGEQC